MQERELAAQGNLNNIPLSRRLGNMLIKSILAQHATGDETLKPEEVSTLQSLLGRLMSVSSSGPDENKNALPEKDMAAGRSCDSEIGGKSGYSASDVTYNKKVESRLADIETKLAHHQSLHEEHNRFRQIIVEQIKADHRNTVQVLNDDVAKLQNDFREMKSQFQLQFTEIIDLLNMQTPSHVHKELTVLIGNMGVYLEGRIQTMERRSESLEVMVRKLTEKITKLHLVCEVCGAPNVQGDL